MIGLLIAAQLIMSELPDGTLVLDRFEIDMSGQLSHKEHINQQWQEYLISSGCASKTSIVDGGTITCNNVSFNESDAPRENIKLNNIESIHFNNVDGFDYGVFDDIKSLGSVRIEYSEINSLDFLINKKLNGLYYIFGFNYKLKDLSFFDKLDFDRMDRINIFSYYHDQAERDGLYNLPDSSGLFCYYQRHGKIRSFYNNISIKC